MKFCTHCGAQCKDSAMFCTTCGHKLNEAAQQGSVPPPQPNVPPQQAVPPQQSVPPQKNIPPQPNVPPQYSAPPQQNVPPKYAAPPQQNMPPYQAPPGQYSRPMKPVASTVRTSLLEMLQSPVLIVAAILLSCSVLLSFINVCMSNAYNYAWVNVFTLIPAILGVIGLWVLYVGAMTSRSHGTPLSMASLPIFKISMIIQIVATCIFTVAIDILLIIGMVGVGEMGRYSRYSYYGVGNSETAMAMAMLIIALVLVTAYQILAILYYVKGIRVVTDIRISLEMGQQPNLFSKYFIVMSFIIGVGAALGGIGVLVLAGISGLLEYSAASSVMTFLSSLASAAFYFVIGVSLSKLNHSYSFQTGYQKR